MSIKRNDCEWRKELRVVQQEKTPHWQRFGKGWVDVTFNANPEGRWLSIDTTESAEKSSKRTMITLDSNEMAALYQMLKDVMEKQPA